MRVKEIISGTNCLKILVQLLHVLVEKELKKISFETWLVISYATMPWQSPLLCNSCFHLVTQAPRIEEILRQLLDSNSHATLVLVWFGQAMHDARRNSHTKSRFPTLMQHSSSFEQAFKHRIGRYSRSVTQASICPRFYKQLVINRAILASTTGTLYLPKPDKNFRLY
jgi:hypothetical protein